jgi:release factor glutamine methyltransferase
MQVGHIYREAEQELREFVEARETSSIEAYSIVSFVINKEKSFLLTYPEYEISDSDVETIRNLVKDRLKGEPLAYILGLKEFWSLPLKVTKDTLIPRPDTETVVEQALLKIQNFKENVVEEKLHILDMGTGSGAIALALKKELPNATIDAIDYSEGAVAVAKFNSENLKLPINVKNSDWFEKIKPQHQYHVIASNPPYIAQNDPHLKSGDVQFEPTTALIAPMQGLYDILNIIREAGKFLVDGGWLIIEHGYQQASDVRGLFNQAGFTNIETIKDLGYNDRVTLGCFKYK